MILQRVMKKTSGCLSALIPGHLQFFRRAFSLTQYIRLQAAFILEKPDVAQRVLHTSAVSL